MIDFNLKDSGVSGSASGEVSREVQYGYCHCGCGNKTNIARQSDIRTGKIKGQPNKFILGHSHLSGTGKCGRGHAYEKNSFIRVDGYRECKACRNLYARFFYRKKQGEDPAAMVAKLRSRIEELKAEIAYLEEKES